EALPDCRLTCRTGPSHANLDALAARAVDMAVAADIDALPDGIERHALMRDPYVLITAHGLIGPDADPIETLRRAPMTGFGAPQLMQRQIAAQFRRLRFDAAPRFQFDTNHAAMAMVVRTRGWTVTTPLGFLRTPRFHDRLEMRPLPFSGFARTLSLYAREGVLGALPAQAATILRRAIAAETIAPAQTLAPWLEGSLRLIDDIEALGLRPSVTPAAATAREPG
ncbi:MAG: substrate-binding domain-containing protein, partial [Pseudomonadota bacterium]